MAPKRERSTNFTREECDILMKLIEDNKDVLQNKKSDAATWAEKERSWKKIEKSFNSISKEQFRSAKSLKIKYDGFKRETKKKSAVIRAETYCTGSGPSIPVLTPTEEKVKGMFFISVDGTDSTFDSDQLQDTEATHLNTKIEVDTESSNHVIIENPPKHEPLSDEDEQPRKRKISESVSSHTSSSTFNAVTDTKWSHWEPKSNKSKKHATLSVTKTKRPFERVADSNIEIDDIQKILLEEELVNKRKQWEFEEEERQHKKEMWLLEKQYWLNKLEKNVNKHYF